MGGKTSLYGEHLKLGAKIINFSNWEMPLYYTNVIDEHITTRTKAGLFDISHMGEFFIEGKDAFMLLQKLITNDLNKLEDGKAFYSAMCLENGGMVDDLIVYRFNQNRFMLAVNAANIEKDFKWFLKSKIFFDDANVIDKTGEIAKLDLQGPKAEEILQRLTNADLKNLKRFYFVENKVNNIPTIISRTGYTAEDGFELYLIKNSLREFFISQDRLVSGSFSENMKRGKKASVQDATVEQWNRLLDVGKEFGLKPIGLGARDTLRTEAGYSLYGHELTENINPFEAGIGFVVNFDKDFIGKQALLKQKDNLKRKIIAFEMLDRAIARQNYEIFKNSNKIGFVTSGTFSPTFKKPIGMAMLSINEAYTGNEIEIKIRDSLHKAKVVEKPIYGFRGKTKL